MEGRQAHRQKKKQGSRKGLFGWAFSGFPQKKAAQTNQTACFGFVL
jgi:hypothetical protein